MLRPRLQLDTQDGQDGTSVEVVLDPECSAADVDEEWDDEVRSGHEEERGPCQEECDVLSVQKGHRDEPRQNISCESC